MNDYAKGAIEALIWVQYIMKKYRKRADALSIVEKEIETAKDELNSGIAIDFRDKISYRVS